MAVNVELRKCLQLNFWQFNSQLWYIIKTDHHLSIEQLSIL